MFTGMFSTLILHTSYVFELQQIFSYKSDALLSFDHFVWFYKNMWTKLRCKLLGIHKTDTCIYSIIFQQSVKFDLNFNKKMFKHAYWFLISLCFLLSMLYIWYILYYINIILKMKFYLKRIDTLPLSTWKTFLKSLELQHITCNKRPLGQNAHL